jgi:hypothetical protein
MTIEQKVLVVPTDQADERLSEWNKAGWRATSVTGWDGPLAFSFVILMTKDEG